MNLWDIKRIKLANSNFIINTDILIVGAGIEGLLCAYYLSSKYKVTLIDKDKVSAGITSNTTAKISYIQKNVYSNIYKYHNILTAKKYLDSQIAGTNILLDIITKNKIDCDLENVDSYLFASTKKGNKVLRKEKQCLEKMGIKCTNSKLPINFPNLKCFYVKDTYTIHPLKFTYGILELIKDRVNILENTNLIKVKKSYDRYIIKTNKGIMLAKKVIITTNYPYFIKPFYIPLKTYVLKEFVVTGKYKIDKHFSAINVEEDSKSIRFYQDNIIYTSNSNRINNYSKVQESYKKCREDFIKYFKTEPTYLWNNQDVCTYDGIPYIKSKDNLYVITGFNGWGLTNSAICSKIVCDLINKTDNKYTKLFCKDRVSLYYLGFILANMFYNIKGYISGYLYKNKIIYSKNIKGLKCNVYEDKNGLHIVNSKCPHMKCNLIFNEEEHTWDCPCHASRFDIDGNPLIGPANVSIKVEDKKS